MKKPEPSPKVFRSSKQAQALPSPYPHLPTRVGAAPSSFASSLKNRDRGHSIAPRLRVCGVATCASIHRNPHDASLSATFASSRLRVILLWALHRVGIKA